MRLKSFFWNAHERRLRAGWRLLIAAVLCALFVILPMLVLGWFVTGYRTLLFIGPVVILAGVLSALAVAGRCLDRRRITDYGLALDRSWWSDFAFGLVLGIVLVTAVFLIEWSAGWLEVVGRFAHADPGESFAVVFSSLLVLFVCVGLYEEIAFRGYPLHNLAEGLNYPLLGPSGAQIAALLLTAGLFGIVHGINPHATILSIGNTVLAGLLFGSGYLWTGRLAMPVGLHISWNFFQGPVFGFPVSGADFGGRLIATQQIGPDLWTGGGYGPEGGLLGTGALLVGMLLLAAWVRGRYGTILPDRSLTEPPTAYRPKETGPPAAGDGRTGPEAGK